MILTLKFRTINLSLIFHVYTIAEDCHVHEWLHFFFFSFFFFYIPLPVYLLSNITLTHKSGKKGETREKNIYILTTRFQEIRFLEIHVCFNLFIERVDSSSS